jgi:hypothetical protein
MRLFRRPFGDDAVDSLLKDLDEAIRLLDSAGEEHWRAWLARGRAEVASGDAHGLDRLLSTFGGMGSFNWSCANRRPRVTVGTLPRLTIASVTFASQSGRDVTS